MFFEVWLGLLKLYFPSLVDRLGRSSRKIWVVNQIGLKDFIQAALTIETLKPSLPATIALSENQVWGKASKNNPSGIKTIYKPALNQSFGFALGAAAPAMES